MHIITNIYKNPKEAERRVMNDHERSAFDPSHKKINFEIT